MPGTDEDAGTWPSWSILRGLIPHSIFEVKKRSRRGIKMGNAWNKSPKGEADIFIDLHMRHL